MNTITADYLAEMARELTSLAERNGLWSSARLLRMAYLDLSKAAHGIEPALQPLVAPARSPEPSAHPHLRLAK